MRPKRYVPSEVKSEGKLNIAQNLCNMDDRLEYIEELRNEMMEQIQSTEMVCFLPTKYPTFTL